MTNVFVVFEDGGCGGCAAGFVREVCETREQAERIIDILKSTTYHELEIQEHTLR